MMFFFHCLYICFKRILVDCFSSQILSVALSLSKAGMTYFDLILKGVVTGFILSIMIGPVFFVLLETSITKGIRAALALDFGVLLSDLLYILIAYVFYSEVASLGSKDNRLIMILSMVFLFSESASGTGTQARMPPVRPNARCARV